MRSMTDEGARRRARRHATVEGGAQLRGPHPSFADAKATFSRASAGEGARAVASTLSGFHPRQPALAQQRLRPRRAAAEGGVGLVGLAAVAGGVDIVAQAFRQRGIEDVAAFLESLEAVGVERLRPEVAVIAGRIGRARE